MNKARMKKALKKMLPPQNHPELKPGEVLIYDCDADEPDDFAAIEYQTKRAGKISYWPNGSVRPHYFPVFVREDEYFQEVPEVKIGQ